MEAYGEIVDGCDDVHLGHVLAVALLFTHARTFMDERRVIIQESECLTAAGRPN